jgi:hypothetical protein
MKRFLETLILRSEFSEIIAPFSNAEYSTVDVKYLSEFSLSFIKQQTSALNRQYKGTGLGLAIVKRIVELHGEQVSVTSTVGSGSCFVVDLPYVTPESSLLASQSASESNLEDSCEVNFNTP